MAALCADTPFPIALDEELIGVNDPARKAELLDTIRPQYIILKPSLHGGLHGAKEWIDLATGRGIGSWMTSALETNVGGLLFTDNVDYPLHIEGDCLWCRNDGQEPDLLNFLQL